MNLAIVRYNAGNTASVVSAVRRLGVEPSITDDPELLSSADKVIFPGVGEASTAMVYLRERGLDRVIQELRQPVLGICLGMQLMCLSSEENDSECLNIVPVRVRRFPRTGLKVPHIGWNSIRTGNSKLFIGVRENTYVYFVHAYYVETGNCATALCTYGIDITVAFEYGNFFGVQFHPERSGSAGEQILENFLRL